jgi:ketosteroid isomerase-like protein
MTNHDAQPDDHRSVRDWMDAWGAEVAAVDLDAGRLRFDDGLVAFGTHAFAVRGADRVRAEQWSQVWPTIEGFRFLTDELIVQVSPDRLQAVVIVSWASTGIGPDGARFDRPGRATVVLVRDAVGAPWRGTHTHFSLGRGVPDRSHGTAGA